MAGKLPGNGGADAPDIEESKQQAWRLEELLSALGISHSAVKDTAMSFAGAMAGLMHAPAPDEVIKNSFANFAFEPPTRLC